MTIDHPVPGKTVLNHFSQVLFLAFIILLPLLVEAFSFNEGMDDYLPEPSRRGRSIGSMSARHPPKTLTGPVVADSELQISVAERFQLLATLRKPGATGGELFGWSLALLGREIIVGVPCDDSGAPDAGAAYSYDALTGISLRTFLNPAPEPNDQFGLSVAASSEGFLIGTPYDDAGANNAGTAFLFPAANPTSFTTFQKPVPFNGDLFGRSVIASEDHVLIGAPFDDTVGMNAGRAYLFNASTAQLIRVFQSPNPSEGEYFGWSLALAGDNILITAPGSDLGVQDAGAAYLFDSTNGNLLHSFHKPTPVEGDYFGWSAAGMQTNLLVGAIGDDTGAVNAGAVYLFDTSGGLVRTFSNPAPADTDQFGLSVAIMGTIVIVGSPYDDTGAPDAGAVYIIDVATGSLLQTLQNPTPVTQDYFGWSVAAVGSVIVIGAPYDDATLSDTGSAYVFIETTSFAGGGGRIVMV